MDPIFMAPWCAYGGLGFLAGRNALVLNTCINGSRFWFFSVIIYAQIMELNAIFFHKINSSGCSISNELITLKASNQGLPWLRKTDS